MSHRMWNALFFALASIAVAGNVRAQQASAAAPAAGVQPGPQAHAQASDPSPAAGQSGPQGHAQVSNSSPAAGVQPGPQADAQAPTPSSNDQSSTPSSPPAASKSLTTIVVNGGPSADILRSARNAGFTVKIANGTTHFCKSEAPLGSRFVSEHCMNEQQVTLFLERAEDQREKLSHMLGAPAVSH